MLGFVTTFLSVVVLLPIAALVWASGKHGWAEFWSAVTAPEAVAALKLTLGAAIIVSVINAVLGTITAWVLVRDDFAGKNLMNAVIDLPFALPTIVGGLTLLALYGPTSPVGVNIAFTRTAIVLALLFETLPFVVRTVQPVLHELDRETEEAARSLGAREREGDAREDRREEVREDDPGEDGRPAGAERGRGLFHLAVELEQHGLHGPHHERQRLEHQREEDRGACERDVDAER